MAKKSDLLDRLVSKTRRGTSRFPILDEGVKAGVLEAFSLKTEHGVRISMTAILSALKEDFPESESVQSLPLGTLKGWWEKYKNGDL